MQQETTDDLVARFRAALEQKDIAAREWERQAGQLSASLNAARAKLDHAQAACLLLREILDSEALCNCGPQFRDAAELEKRIRLVLGETHAALDVGEEG